MGLRQTEPDANPFRSGYTARKVPHGCAFTLPQMPPTAPLPMNKERCSRSSEWN